MKFNLGICSIFLFVCSGVFAQYKYDLGIKISSLEEERILLEQRFHLKSPYTIVATYAYGSHVWFDSRDGAFSDSTFSTNSEFHKYWFNTVKIGVQRRITGVACNVFYAGMSVGVGYQKQRNSFTESTFSLYDTLPSNQPSMVQYEEVSFNELHQYSNYLQAQVGLTFGMDVPISSRFLINGEVGVLGNLAKYIGSNSSFAEVKIAFSGGVRYQFGKRE